MAGIPGIGSGGASIPGLTGGNALGALQGGQQNPLQQIPGMEQLVAKLMELLKSQQGQQGQQAAQGGGAPQGGGAAPAGGAQGPSAQSQGAPGGLEDIMSQIIKKLQENPEQAQQILGALPPQLQQALGAALKGGGGAGAAIGAVRAGK